MSVLLDANVLIALAVKNHAFHPQAQAWFATLKEPFATCAITQGALLRVLLAQKIVNNAEQAWAQLQRIQSVRTAQSQHEFWPQSENYLSVSTRGILGHKQITDAYLAQLARARGAKIATFDQGLAALNLDCALLIRAI